MCEELPEDSNVLRYVRPSAVREDGTVDGAAFRLRPHERRLSVNWMECFGEYSEAERVRRIARLIRMQIRPTGRFAKLSVGGTRRRVAGIRFLHCPLAADGAYEADPSHSEIDGIPPGDSPESEWVGDLIAACIENAFPVLVEVP